MVIVCVRMCVFLCVHVYVCVCVCVWVGGGVKRKQKKNEIKVQYKGLVRYSSILPSFHRCVSIFVMLIII